MYYSAGLGVVSFMKQAVARVVGNDSPQVQGSDNFWLVDKDVSTTLMSNVSISSYRFVKSA